jgi:hypothetical protein
LNFEQAKAQLDKEWEERQETWRREAQERTDAGTPRGMDYLFLEKTFRRNWFEKFWWPTRRFMLDNIWHRYWWDRLLSRIERSYRGWGRQDWWNLNNYVARSLPGALRKLAKDSHGFPCDILDENGKSMIYEETENQEANLSMQCLGGFDDDDNDEEDPRPRIWAETLERMARGFDAFEVLSENGWFHESESEKELERMYKEGFMLFFYNFYALWD